MLSKFKQFFSKLVSPAINEKLYINVPYSEKDIAKSLGAKWDPQKKSWFISSEVDQKPFEKWFQQNNTQQSVPNIRANGFYIAESIEQCWKCQRATPVFAFLLPEQHQRIEYDDIQEQDFWITVSYQSFVSFLEHLNKGPLRLMEKITSDYFLDFSQQASTKYFMNHCKHCKSKLGDFYMHSEPGGAFFPATDEDANSIKLHWNNNILLEAHGSYSFDPWQLLASTQQSQ